MSTLSNAECVTLTGRLTVGTVEAGKETLLAAIRHNASIVVRIDTEADVDVAGVQLLMAARAFAARKSISLTLAAPASDALLDVLHRGGFIETPSQDDRKFWFHGETA